MSMTTIFHETACLLERMEPVILVSLWITIASAQQCAGDGKVFQLHLSVLLTDLRDMFI